MHSKTRFTAAALVGALLPAAMVMADNFEWNAGTGDWNDGNNWDNVSVDPPTTGIAPSGGGGNHAYVGNGGTAEITGSIGDFQDIFIGSNRKGDVAPVGTVNHSAGSTFQGTGSWMFVGEGGGTGTYNMSGTAVQDKARIYVGRDNGTGLGGNGTFTMTDFAYMAGEEINIGEGPLASGVTGTASFAGDALVELTGNFAFQAGTVDVTGNAAITAGGEIFVANGAGKTGVMNIDSGTMTTNSWVAVGRDGANGTLNMSGSAVLNSTGGTQNHFITLGAVGDGGTGTINISGNAEINADTGMILGETANSNSGVVNQSGGTITVVDFTPNVDGGQPLVGSSLIIGNEIQSGGLNAGTNSYHLSGGTLNTQTVTMKVGTFQQSGGTFNVTTFDQAGGTLVPGASAGTLHLVGGDYNLSGGTIEIEIGGTTAGSQHDQVIVDGAITITGGSLVTSIINGFSAAVGQQFDVMDFTSLTGTFDSIVGTPGAGLAWDDSLLYTDGILSVVAGGLPGDTNGDGDVDNADLQTAISNFTGPQTNPPTFTKTVAQGDNNSDGAVSNVDLQTAISNFTGPIGPAPVPEPASLALLGLGGLLIARRRR